MTSEQEYLESIKMVDIDENGENNIFVDMSCSMGDGLSFARKLEEDTDQFVEIVMTFIHEVAAIKS